MTEFVAPKPLLVATSQNKRPSRIPTRPLSSSEGKGSKASPARTRTRHASGNDKKAGISYSSSKENIAPAPAKKPNPKSHMSYMELKRRHENLVSVVQTQQQKSRETEEQHQWELHRFAKEIGHYKESHAALREEISSYKATIDERNRIVSDLQQQLEEIKFENERLAAVLEGARVDPVTGERIKKATQLQSNQHLHELDLQMHEQNLDAFISGLETMVTVFQEQKEKISHSQYLQSDH